MGNSINGDEKIISVLATWIIMTYLAACGVAAGLMGSLLGLGGATILIPILVMTGIPMNYASGAGLLSALATSCSSCSRLLMRGLINQRLAIGLSSMGTAGAIIGSFLSYYMTSHGLEYVLHLMFSAVMFVSMYLVLSKKSMVEPSGAVEMGSKLYQSLAVMLVGGLFSGLLGIGGGPINLVALYWVMGLPLRVATATSNLMVGMTAATSGSLYWIFGYIQPMVAVIAAIGTAMGAQVGSAMLPRIKGSLIKLLLMSVFAYLAIRMLISGLRLMNVMEISQGQEYLFSAVAALISTALIVVAEREGNYDKGN